MPQGKLTKLEQRAQEIEQEEERQKAALTDDVPAVPEQTSEYSHSNIEVIRTKSIGDVMHKFAPPNKYPLPALKPGDSNKFRCPWPEHADNNPSAWINTDNNTWFCGTCEGGGGNIDLAAAYLGYTDAGQKLSVGTDSFRKTLHEIEREFGLPTPTRKATPPPLPSRQAPPANSSNGAVRIKLTRASQYESRPVEWLWDERVPTGEITLTAGRGGIGKSTAHAWLVAAITRGVLPGKFKGQPKACLVTAAEDDWPRTIRPRLEAAGADLDLVFNIEAIKEEDTDVALTLPLHLNHLRGAVEETGAVLMSCDPLISVIAEGLDTYKDREIRAALEPLAKLANKTDLAIIGNAHFNKAGRDLTTAIMGGAGFFNVSRAAISFVRDEIKNDGYTVVSQIKNNLGRLDVPSLRYRIVDHELPTPFGPTRIGRLEWDSQVSAYSGQEIMNRLAQPGPKGHSAETQEIDKWLRDFLSNGPKKAKEVLEAGDGYGGYSKMQLHRSSKRIGVTPYKETGTIQGQWYWSLPDDDVPIIP